MIDAQFYASARTLVGSQHFLSGSTCPSTPLLRKRRLASLSERAVNSQNFWRLSNVHRWAFSPALCRRSSEKEKKLSNNSSTPVTTLVYLQDVSRAYSSGFIRFLHILWLMKPEEYPHETSCKYTNVVPGVLELFERMNTQSGSLKSYLEKLLNQLAASSFFQNFRRADLRSHNNWSVWYPAWSDWCLIEGTCRGNGTYAKVRASLATALLRGKSIRQLYESLLLYGLFLVCLPFVCLWSVSFPLWCALLSLQQRTHWGRTSASVFSWLVIGEGPEYSK